jgi:uncharacterized membrane protein YuzA (DUF378 family)
MSNSNLKSIDLVIWTLLVIGGLNWGLVGLFNFDLVATIFGPGSLLTRVVYGLVGFSALYDILFIKSIWKRWGISLLHPAHA